MSERENHEGKQDYLSTIGIEVSDVGKPFFRPTSRPTLCVFTGAAPGPKEPKQTPKGPLTILAVVDLTIEGVEHAWEITSKRALERLREVVAGPGQLLEISRHGSGSTTTYTIDRGVEFVGPRISKGDVSAQRTKDGRVAITASGRRTVLDLADAPEWARDALTG